MQILVPPLSQTSDTLVLVEWRKRVGEPVAKGDILFTVETDKATLEVESPGSGILQAIYAQPNDEIAVRSVIGVIAEEDAPLPPAEPRPALPARHDWIFASPRARHLARREGAALSNMRPTGPRGMIVERDVRAYLAERDAPAPAPRLTPVARRMAAEHALDPAELPASEGVIRRADVEAALSAREPAAAPGVRRVPLSALRRAIQRRLEANARAAVPVTLTRLVDATELVALRDRLLPRFEGGARPTYTDFLILIAARALREHSALNGTFDGEALALYDEVHMGLAVDTERGLVVPVLRSAGALGLAECAARRADLVARAQADALAPDEMSGGSFTLTNLGVLGVDAFTPVLNPPQIAILGVGRIVSAPAAYRGGVALREQMHLSLTFDHRATDGAPAARLLASIAERIEHPELVWV